MSDRTEAAVKADLVAARVDVGLAGKLSKGAGLRLDKAESFVKTNKASLVVKDVEMLRRLFQADYPKYVAKAQASFAYHAHTFKMSMNTYGQKYQNATFFDWRYLYPAIRVITVDFVYQGFGRRAPGMENRCTFAWRTILTG